VYVFEFEASLGSLSPATFQLNGQVLPDCTIVSFSTSTLQDLTTPAEATTTTTFEAVTYEGPYKAHCGAVEYLLQDTSKYWSLDAALREITLQPQTANTGSSDVVVIARLQDYPSVLMTIAFTNDVITCMLNSFTADSNAMLP